MLTLAGRARSCPWAVHPPALTAQGQQFKESTKPGELLQVAAATCESREPSRTGDVSMSKRQSEVWSAQVEWQLLT